MNNWKQMPYFIEVARSGSLRAAAEQMNATHATVRTHIQTLEASLGVQLFRRAQSGLSLTVAGKMLLVDVVEAEKLLIRGRNQVQGLDRVAAGLIRVSLDPMMGHYLMAPIFAEFCQLHPDIELEIRLTYEVEDITRLQTDVSIRNAAEITDDVVARKLFPTASGIYASRTYIDETLPKAGRLGENLTWIGYGDVAEQQWWVNNSPFPKAALRHHVRDTEMHLHMVRAGAGLTILPTWFDGMFPELQRVPKTHVMQNRFTWVLLHSDLQRVARIRVFVDYISNALLEVRAKILRGK